MPGCLTIHYLKEIGILDNINDTKQNQIYCVTRLKILASFPTDSNAVSAKLAISHGQMQYLQCILNKSRIEEFQRKTG